MRSSSRRFWNDAAGEDDGVEAAVGGEVGARLGGGVGERVVEARGDHAHRHAVGDVAVDGEDRLAGVEHAGHHVEPVGAPLGAVAGRLELHRRLPLVGDLEPQPAERGDRVEQAPDRCRDGRRRAGLGHPRDRAPALGVDAAQRARVAAGAGRHAHAIRHGSRAARVAAGERDRPQVAGALEAPQVADEDLSSPHRAVGAEAGAVEDRPHRRPGLAVLGQARRRGGRGGAGRRRARRPRGRARRSWTGSRGAGRGRRPRARPRTAARSAPRPRRRSRASRRS